MKAAKTSWWYKTQKRIQKVSLCVEQQQREIADQRNTSNLDTKKMLGQFQKLENQSNQGFHTLCSNTAKIMLKVTIAQAEAAARQAIADAKTSAPSSSASRDVRKDMCWEQIGNLTYEQIQNTFEHAWSIWCLKLRSYIQQLLCA